MSTKNSMGSKKLDEIVSNYENLILSDNDILFLQFKSEKLDKNQLKGLQDWLYDKLVKQVQPKYKEQFNVEHGITPQGIRKAIRDISERVTAFAQTKETEERKPVTREELARLIKDLEGQMKKAAKNLEFEKAALLRDRIVELRKDEELVAPGVQSQTMVDRGRR